MMASLYQSGSTAGTDGGAPALAAICFSAFMMWVPGVRAATRSYSGTATRRAWPGPDRPGLTSACPAGTLPPQMSTARTRTGSTRGDRPMLPKNWIAAVAVGVGLAVAGPAFAQEKLTVWWVKGFYKAEDDALFAAIKKFEEKNKNVKVELSQYPVQDMIPKTVSALDSGSPPDVAYADVYDFQVTAKWAYDGKLEDITSVIDPIRARFEPAALATTFLYNDQTKSRAYYAFPIKQQTMHIQYWKDMLADAGFKESDIPTTWKEYWSFWCDKVQPAHRQKSGTRGYATGFPMGVDSSDSFYSFLTFMDAYNVKLVSDSGKLLVDDPTVRQGLINAMTDYTAPYTKNCVAFMLDESNLTPYVEGALGRWFPVTKNAQQSAFWKTDPHRLAVYNQFMSGTVPFEFTKNYKFTVLNNENVWAKAMNRILSEKVPVDKAVDEMIARIKAVAGS